MLPAAPSTEALQESDLDLLGRCREGDLDALGTLYRRHRRPIYLYACSLTGDPASADDVVQQTFLRALKADPRAIRHTVRRLLFGIARNLIRDEARRADAARRVVPRLVPAGASDPVLREDLARLSEALARLTEAQRETVILKTHAGLTFAELAELLREPEGTVKTRYRDALHRLARLMSEVPE